MDAAVMHGLFRAEPEFEMGVMTNENPESASEVVTAELCDTKGKNIRGEKFSISIPCGRFCTVRRLAITETLDRQLQSARNNYKSRYCHLSSSRFVNYARTWAVARSTTSIPRMTHKSNVQLSTISVPMHAKGFG